MGLVCYSGPSMIDGSPILGILTNENKSGYRSENSKIGNLAQLWILPRDVSPSEAVKTGQDHGICGSCVHRGESDGSHAVGRTCYVNVSFAPNAIWHAYHRGSYKVASEALLEEGLSGRKLRLGAYGDPVALPVGILEDLTGYASGQVGYTHQWGDPRSDAYRHLVMASCESEYQAARARHYGWRTFRVRPAGSPVLSGEIECPASEEKGKVRTCETCMACDGSDRAGKASVSIILHGGLGVKHSAGRMFEKVGVAG